MRFLLDQDVPEDLTYLLRELNHEVLRLRDVLPPEVADFCRPRVCSRARLFIADLQSQHFLKLAETTPHRSIIVVIRRKTRAPERAALLRLLERAGEGGLRDNINFA